LGGIALAPIAVLESKIAMFQKKRLIAIDFGKVLLKKD